MDINDLWGTKLNGQTLTISTDPSDTPVDVKTVDIWMKADSDSGLTTNLDSADTIYTNGGTSTILKKDEWQVRTFVFSTAHNSSITITGTGTVGRVVLYEDSFTASQVANAYNASVGRNITRINDISVIGVTEPAGAADLYARDWAISVAG
jgi:hypothetical protein